MKIQTPTPVEEKFGRFPDVERIYSIRRSKCYELIWKGKIKSAVIDGIRLIDLESVERHLRANTV